LTALVADDVPAVRKLYGSVLAPMGFAVVEAADGVEALQKWRETSPALIILDLNMPKLDGLKVLEEKSRGSLPGEVMIISAKKDQETVRKVAALGACSYLSKPVNINEFRSRVTKLMRMPQARLAISKVMKAETDRQALTQSRQIVVYDTSNLSRNLYMGIFDTLGHQAAMVGDAKEFLTILSEDMPDRSVIPSGA